MTNYVLRDLIKIKNGRDHKHLGDGDIPVYGSGGVMRYVDEFLYDQESILLPRKGTLNNIQYANKPFWTVDTIYYTELNKELVEGYFLYYYLRLLDLSKLNSGTGVPSMTFGAYYSIKVNAPNLPTQKKIAKVLSDLDAKIELNNKINAELEAMAKTIYDYWFVQFDFPNQEGKPYKTSGGAMTYNPELKRDIPEGWEVKELGEIEPNIVTGKTPSTKVVENFGGEIPFITIDDIRQNLFVYNTKRTLSKRGAEMQCKKYIDENDICVSCIGTVGIIGFVGKRSQTNQQINTISQPKDYNRYFLFHYLKDYFGFNTAAKKGAVLSNMNRGEFVAIPIIKPNKDLRQLYFDNVDSLFKTIANNQKETQKLEELRDWLLPMLMNGQVSVADNKENSPQAKQAEANKA